MARANGAALAAMLSAARRTWRRGIARQRLGRELSRASRAALRARLIIALARRSRRRHSRQKYRKRMKAAKRGGGSAGEMAAWHGESVAKWRASVAGEMVALAKSENGVINGVAWRRSNGGSNGNRNGIGMA